MYEYRAKYIKNYDGDTATFDIDLGFNITNRIVIRFLGINTKELRGAKGQNKIDAIDAKLFVENCLKDCDNIIIKTVKDKKGKYGRYLGIVYYNNTNLCEQLLSEGLALPYI